MRILHTLDHPLRARESAVTIGNFDGVHRGHQAMLALLRSEAAHRRLPACVLTFEPHPRDFFAQQLGQPALAPPRIATLRDKLEELARCGVDQVVVLRFDAQLAALSATSFIERVLCQGLGARYVLVGDDFRFGARRQGDYAVLDAAGHRAGFDVARMMSYEVHGTRVSSSSVRAALAAGHMDVAAQLLGRPYAVSGHVVHGAQLGRELGQSRDGAGDGFRTLNVRFPYQRAAVSGIFVARVRGLSGQPLPAVASFGLRPSVNALERPLLEVHVLDWPATLGREGGYGKIVRVELLHKLRDEARYDTLAALTHAIAADTAAARAWHLAAEDAHAAKRRQTTRDRI